MNYTQARLLIALTRLFDVIHFNTQNEKYFIYEEDLIGKVKELPNGILDYFKEVKLERGDEYLNFNPHNNTFEIDMINVSRRFNAPLLLIFPDLGRIRKRDTEECMKFLLGQAGEDIQYYIERERYLGEEE